MNPGDLVKINEDAQIDHGSWGSNRDPDDVGVILTWVRTGGKEPAIFSVLWPDGESLESEDYLEVVNEKRNG